MNSENSSGREMNRRRFSLRGLFLIVTAIAVALVIGLQSRRAAENRQLNDENQRLAEEVAQLKFELEMQQIDFNLKVPSEALYYRYMPRAELDRLRWEAFEQFGVEDELVPLTFLYDHTRKWPAPLYFNGPWRTEKIGKGLQGTFWEGYAVNHAGDGAKVLVFRLKNSADFRRRLTEDPKTVEEYLKPLLLRLVKAPNPDARYNAIEALLLLDDRSQIVLDVLRESLQRPAEWKEGATMEHARFFAFDPPAARRLVEEYHLESMIDTEETSPGPED